MGGLFGYGFQGGNGPLTILIVIELIIALNQFLSKKCSTGKIAFVLATFITIAALGELKFAFILFAFCIIISLIINKKSFKTLLMSLGGIIAVFAGIIMLNKYFPSTTGFYSYESVMEYTSSENHGYATENDLSRIRAFKQIDEMFFNTRQKRLFGFGLGNCSSIPPLKKMSNFYYLYNDTLHYTWLTNAYIYIEIGLLGFLYIFMLFLFLPIQYKKIFKKGNNFNIYLIVSLVVIMMIWYNEFLIYEYSYFVYTLLGIPFSTIKEEKI